MIEDNSLQFVEHNVEEVIEKDSINIVFNIFEGEKILIERVNIMETVLLMKMLLEVN